MNVFRLPLWIGALVLLAFAFTAARAEERSPTWASLTPAQKQVLAPLQRDWATIEPNRRQKWIEVAGKFPTMPVEERQRVQTRMSEWARMTPSERAAARQQFQEVRRVPADERQARWQEYQALSPDARSQLAQQAKPVAKAASAPRSSGDKRNIVRAPAVAPTRVVAPTVVQARPGATTTTMSTRASPPLHHQAGLPKIAATPGFVDPATLLPQRGPQGAAVRTPASADPTAQP